MAESQVATSTATDQPAPGTTIKRLIKRKPARKQVEVGQVEKKQPEQTGQVYNFWYNKWAGGDKYDAYNAKDKSQTRVNIALDSGYTRADGGNNKYICMFFARGCCPKGRDCDFLHRLPLPTHKLPDSALDCFGREKHADYRDDMGGVGSFNRQNRTLYIGKIKQTKDVDAIMEKHFEEFGEIEKIKILQARGVGFVTYRHEISAQFAKEAMMHQSMDNDEVLNVRWATEDPNPTAIVEEAARLIKEGEERLQKALDPNLVYSIRELDELEGVVEPLEQLPDQILPPDEEEEEPSSKRRKLEITDGSEQNILSKDAIQGLRAIAAMRQKQPAQQAVAKPKTALAALGGYGSDSD